MKKNEEGGAEITLSDWTCGSNGCVNPLLHSDSPHLPRRPRLLPSTWSLASSTLSSLALSFIPTDLSFVLHGHISLRHLHTLFSSLHPTFPRLPTKTLSNFEKHRFKLLKDFGSFAPLLHFSSLPSFIPFLLQFPSHQYYLTRDWPLLNSWFSFLQLLLRSICLPDSSVLLPPSHRKHLAENSILALAKAPLHSYSYSHPSQYPHLLATDGSMICDPLSGRKSVTFAIAAKGNVFSASLPHSKHDTNILHGEAYAIVTASLLSLQGDPNHRPHIISDHLNSVNLLHSNPSTQRLLHHPARALYRWILDIWSRLHTTPTLTHVCAHTSAHTVESNLNRLVDHVASSSQNLPLPPPSVPTPSFFMDNFMLFSTSHGLIESSLLSFVDTLLAKAQATSLNSCHEPIPSLLLFDNTLPPTYPYIKAPSSYSAVIQLYARSGQLDTTQHLSSRLKEGHQPWCRFGCKRIEDARHIFVICPKFTTLRESYTMRLQDATCTILNAYNLPQRDIAFITERVSNLFYDSNVWPSQRTAFYLGILPRLVPPSHMASIMHSRLAHNAHTLSIQLAGRIWGSTRQAARIGHKQLRDRTLLSLPNHLSLLFHNLSYPSFTLTFS